MKTDWNNFEQVKTHFDTFRKLEAKFNEYRVSQKTQPFWSWISPSWFGQTNCPFRRLFSIAIQFHQANVGFLRWLQPELWRLELGPLKLLDLRKMQNQLFYESSIKIIH